MGGYNTRPIPKLPSDLLIKDAWLIIAADNPKTYFAMLCVCTQFRNWLTNPEYVAHLKTKFARKVKTVKQAWTCIEYILPNGRRHGPFEEWTYGVKTKSFHYVDGKMHGKCEQWDIYGLIISRTHYINGKMHGIHETWNARGVRTCLAQYIDFQLRGTYEAWNDYGVRIALSHFDNGKPQNCKEWNAKGVLVYESNYVDGNRDECKIYDDSGKLVYHSIGQSDNLV
jgi:hypothetical protein